MEINKENLPTENSKIVHELAQSLLIIHAYIRGCLERIKNNCLNIEQLRILLAKIDQQVQILFVNIQHLMVIE